MGLPALCRGLRTGVFAGRNVIDRQFFGQLDGSSCPPFSRRRTAPTQKEPDASQDDKKTCHPNTLHPRDLPLERIWQLLRYTYAC